MSTGGSGPSREDVARSAARKWVERRSLGATVPIRGTDLRTEFLFDGSPLPLVDQAGIWKPKWMTAAFTIRTTYTPAGGEAPYLDEVGADGLHRYKWRGTDGDHAHNRALREAMRQQVPLIWFIGAEPAAYIPITDVYLVAEEPEQHQFVVSVGDWVDLRPDSPAEAWVKRYLTAQTKQRLHQPMFRAGVIRAYEQRCAVCALNHVELLDAAHIVPDADEAGVAAIRNGLAMCKIHHAAYDRGFLGIRPDLVVQIRQDLLDEEDGPMLLHGLQGRHGQKLMQVPKRAQERPDAELLEISWSRFKEHVA